ncbi:SpoIIE family protein phosphatase [Streptomyces sp. 891-h]|uniref:SpoIIE family protein phosphatase n=1 Tax=Streptomyces sp. 891-h TaxID=2720714 RepID=UPI001FAB0D6D|nr:SpoIIE family protein phosphatase [Streptomyces sp. 891-h]UNZ20854.1 SpoIIE family protein phosphatase [Streptomyces sp. 891-h]
MGNLSSPGPPRPPHAPVRRFPAQPESVAEARRNARAELAGAPQELAETAELLLSELATNAVLHARTEFEVSVSRSGDTVRVQVSDRLPARGLVPQERRPDPGTGLGLVLVEELAARYGTETGEERKTVWFELGPDGSASPPSGWANAEPPSGPLDTVTLVDMPDALYTAAGYRRNALLRELTLAAAGGDGISVRPQDLATAHDMSNVLTACVAAARRTQPSEGNIRSLRVSVPADAAPALFTLRRVLEMAEEAAGDERLLTRPSLPQNRVFHQWLFDQITSQLSGGKPTAWTVVPREPGASPSELASWDPRQVRDSRVPTIAADEEDRIVAANDPAADLLGWQEDDLLGQPLTVLIPEHLRQRHVSAFTSLQLTGRPRILGRSVPLPALHRDGRQIPVRLLIQTQETADGRTVFVAQLTPRAVDPSERKPRKERAAPQAEPDEQYEPGTQLLEPSGVTSGGETDVTALERLSLLTDTRSALSGSPDLTEGLQHVCRVLTRRLADWCVLDLLDERGHVDRVSVAHREPWRMTPDVREGRLPPVSEAARGPLARVLRGAGPLLLTEIPAVNQAHPLDARHLELFEQLGGTSAVVAPLRVRREVLGALTVARGEGRRPFTEKDLPLVDDLVRNLALGVDNVRLYQETRDIAERLQHSLLPVLPESEHLQVAARYASSSTTAQVGGDWYDCFLVPGGETALVIGDVAGHDLEAAVAMSQLRSMLRGIAVDRREPPEVVLRRLDLANHSLYREATATCVYALVKGPEQGPWELRHSSAGHPPPLLTTEDGDTRYLDEGAGLLLGMDPQLPRRGARTPLPARSTVLLYTDGLVERRGASLDKGLALLRRHTAELAREPLDVFCDELLIGLGADSDDDIAILAVRPTPSS